MNAFNESKKLPVNPFEVADVSRRRRFRLIIFVFIALLLVTLIAAPFVYRASRLWGIPDVGPPFDVEEFTSYKVPDDENAFYYYEQAAELLTVAQPIKVLNLPIALNVELEEGKPVEEATVPLHKVLEASLTAANKALLLKPEWSKWIDENGEALAVWMKGNACDKSHRLEPSDYHTGVGLETVRKLRQLSWLAIAKAKMLAENGQLDEAWGLYRANFRCSRHLGHRSIWFDRDAGISIHENTSKAVIVDWANQSNITESHLTMAIDDVKKVFELTAPRSDDIKAMYVMRMNHLERGDWKSDMDISLNPPSPWMEWVKNKKEVRRREIQLETLKQFEEERINSYLDYAIRNEMGRQAALITMLATKRYHIKNNRYPSSIEELQAAYPNLTFNDPCEGAAGTLLNYQIDKKKLTVWSVGYDGSNSKGKIENGDRLPFDAGLEFKFAE